MQKTFPYYASVTCTTLIVLVAILSYLGFSPFHVSNRLPSYDLLMSYFTLGLPLFVAGCVFSFLSKQHRGALFLGNLLFIGLPLFLLVFESVFSFWYDSGAPAFEKHPH